MASNQQEIRLFDYERLNTNHPLPRLRVDAEGEPLEGFTYQDLLSQRVFRWIFT